MISTLNGLAATFNPERNKVSDREFDLKDRALDHSKAIDSKKIELQENKMEFEKLRWEEKNKELKKNSRIMLLKIDYEHAMDNARNETDPEMKQMCMQIAKDSCKRYSDHLKQACNEE